MSCNIDQPRRQGLPSRGAAYAAIVLAQLTLSAAWSAPPINWQTPESIRGAAEAFALQQTGAAANVIVEAIAVDERVRLPLCGQPLVANSTRALNNGSGTVTVSCPGPSSWRLFVPVRVSIETPVVVTRRNIQRGDILSEADLGIVVRRSSSLPYEYLSRIEDAVGLTVRRPISEANVVVPAALQRPKVVARGALVTVVARTGGIVVKSDGLAVQGGGLNERIRVQTQSGRIVEGVIESADLVRVGH